MHLQHLSSIYGIASSSVEPTTSSY